MIRQNWKTRKHASYTCHAHKEQRTNSVLQSHSFNYLFLHYFLIRHQISQKRILQPQQFLFESLVFSLHFSNLVTLLVLLDVSFSVVIDSRNFHIIYKHYSNHYSETIKKINNYLTVYIILYHLTQCHPIHPPLLIYQVVAVPGVTIVYLKIQWISKNLLLICLRPIMWTITASQVQYIADELITIPPLFKR